MHPWNDATKVVEDIVCGWPSDRYSDGNLCLRNSLSVTVLIDESTYSSNREGAPTNSHEWLIQYRRGLTITPRHYLSHVPTSLSQISLQIALSLKIIEMTVARDHRTRPKHFLNEIRHFEYQESIVKL